MNNVEKIMVKTAGLREGRKLRKKAKEKKEDKESE